MIMPTNSTANSRLCIFFIEMTECHSFFLDYLFRGIYTIIKQYKGEGY